MVKRVRGESSERKMQQISLSNHMVKRRISEMSDDIKEQIVSNHMFAIQLEESKDGSGDTGIEVPEAYPGSNSECQRVQCMIHRFALVSKTLPDALCKILEAVVKCINFVKAGDLNSRLFQNLCRGMDSEHETLLFYSNVRWLST
ncbi:uncharacterized protein LOC121878000, partial [Homarus americanus]|uniref:uncharacterized protein LOC121878000 n=1 Tax=Homarus americanus TaxID=6706 RepID=UPI001C46AFBD